MCPFLTKSTMNVIQEYLFIALAGLCLLAVVEARFDDKRCKCVCPDTKVANGTATDRRFYINNVPPEDCSCEKVVIPVLESQVNDKIFCPRCSCKFETRNTTTIRVVVIIVIWIISLLVIYMLFLMCLDPLLNKRTTAYQEHTDEETTEVEPVAPIPPTSYATSGAGPGVSGTSPGGTNVLNRVGHQQFKWKKQVQEQRRNIYDRHAMLN